MNKILLIILVVVLSGCATYAWKHKSGNDNFAAEHLSKCNNLVNLHIPSYICRNITYCTPDETNLVISTLTRRNAALNQCMFELGYNKVRTN